MALDRGMGWSQDRKTIGTTPLEMAVPDGGYLLVHNTSTTAIITIYPNVKTKSGMEVLPGSKRTLPRLEYGGLIWIVSDTAGTVVEIWHSQTKWGSDWTTDELRYTDGELWALTGDPLNVAGVPVLILFNAAMGRHAHFFTCIPNVNVDITVFIRGSTVGQTVRVLANEAFTLGPDPALEIVRIDYVNAVALENFELRAFAY